MPTQRPFRFAAMVTGADSGEAFLDRARQIDAYGYSALAMVDHFNPNFSPTPGLTAAAVAVPSLRVICTVYDNDFRNPVLLAKEIATIDQLSNGRVDFGLGAGWLKRDYDQTGIPYERPGVRISRMEEALTVMKGYWSGQPFSFKGEYYTVDKTDGHPPVVQQPHPPVYIGGGGKRILSIAGREADIIGVHMRFGPEGAYGGENQTHQAMQERMDWIRDAAGSRFDEIEFALLVFTVKITSTVAERDDLAARIAEANEVSVENVLASPYYLIGSEQQIVENILQLRESFGFSHFTIGGGSVDDAAPIVDRLAGQ